MPLDRRVLLRAAAVAPLAGLVACGGGEPASRTPSTTASAGGSSVSPSSPSPGRSSSASSPSPSSSRSAPPRPRIADTLATGLDVPWGIAFLPDGSALVSCRDSFEIVRVGGRRTTVVGKVPGVVTTVDIGGEGGLLGLALHPGYPDEPWLYAYHSTEQDNRVVRMRLTQRGGLRLGAPQEVLTGIHTSLHHNGGGLRFAPDGHLYVSTGDAEDRDSAQDKGSLNGKILRITDTGGVPDGNPFGNAVWSYGHRNVEGLALDGDQLWASEFGDHEYDELNRVVKGGNYGWPEVEGSDGQGGYRDPLAQWPTSDCSPSGIAIARGRAWLGALQGQCVWSVDLATGATARHLDGHGRLRLAAAAPDGSLWVGTSNRDGRATPRSGDDRIFRVTL